MAKTGKPIILSTEMANLGEIKEAVEVIRNYGQERIILLHCVMSYPAKPEDMNLRFMKRLENTFNLPTGLSDCTQGIAIPIAAAALGAVMVEKQFTLNKNLEGPDHRASLEPEELEDMVRAIREVEKATGDGVKKDYEEEHSC